MRICRCQCGNIIAFSEGGPTSVICSECGREARIISDSAAFISSFPVPQKHLQEHAIALAIRGIREAENDDEVDDYLDRILDIRGEQLDEIINS